MNLEGIETVGEDSRAPTLRAGRYVLQLEAAIAGKSKKTRNDFIRNEVKVLEAKGEDATKPGTQAVFFINEDVSGFYTPPKHVKDLANYVRALVNEPTTTVTQQMIGNLVADGGKKMAGTTFELEAKPVIDSKTNKPKTFAGGDPILNFTFAPYASTTATMAPATGSTTNTKAARK